MKAKKLILIDGNALVHRAFHALPPLTTRKGEIVNAVYGFTNILLRVIREFRPDYLVATFDLAGPTFRHQEYQEYKATRKKAPQELYDQFDRVKQIIHYFGIPIYEKQGYEADDLIGTIVEQTKNKKNVEVIIVTGDLDTLQLIDEKVKIYTLKKGIKETIIYDKEAVRQRYGLYPSQIVDFKALRGDPSDNIPGVPGIGEKTAILLLKQFATLENLYRHLDKKGFVLEINGKPQKRLQEKLVANRDQAFFSKELATIRKNAPIKFDLNKALWLKTNYSLNSLVKLFKDLEFSSLINRLPVANNGQKNQLELNSQFDIYRTIEKLYHDGVFSKKIYDIEKKLVPIIKKMEERGIQIDLNQLKVFSQEIGLKLLKLQKKIFKLTGTSFNLNSPRQLSQVLFQKLKLPTENLRKTSGGAISTSFSELTKLSKDYPVIKLIESYRELSKLKLTYADSLPKLIGPDGRLHPHFHQLGTATGRISCSEPNLQNIPVRTDLGQKIRQSFVAKKGFQFLSVDYSQLELRIVASIAHDIKMIKAFQEGQDIHKITAAEINNIPLNKVTPEMRQKAKALNFGIIYGMSIHGFAEAAGIDRSEAKTFIEKYMKDFSGIAKYIDSIKKQAYQKGYVTTLLGRRRYIPELKSTDFRLKQAGERMAVNTPIQGTAADLVKLAMIEVDKFFETNKLEAYLLIQIHDELLFEIRKNKIKKIALEIKRIMENVYKLTVPLVVNLGFGDNWGEIKKVK